MRIAKFKKDIKIGRKLQAKMNRYKKKGKMKTFLAYFPQGVAAAKAVNKLPNRTLHQLFIHFHMEGSLDSVTSDLEMKNHSRKVTETQQ